ncbi:hypothetical protein Tco_1020554, partial [Tanacetum coccineum]
CAFKVDIQKAYDTVDWKFLKEVLHGFGFHTLRVRGVYIKLELVNLYFADDLFLFAHGDIHSATIIMEALNEFKLASEGRLPVKYLGVPLISSRLIYRDCKELIEKQLMRGFLWYQGSMQRSKAKVAWDVIWLPKREGGLGLRKLELFNKALMSSHIWDILMLKESLWIKWIHAYKIRDRNFWDVLFRGNMTWGWQKILQLCPILREYIWYRIGDGSKVSMWSNHWCWLVKYPPLNNIIVPNIAQDAVDILEWSDNDGSVKHFSVATVWHRIRPRSEEVKWCDVVWFSKCIPRHALHLWLVIKRCLKTQDRLRIWDMHGSNSTIICPLCKLQSDNHEHLFFECIFSRQVWDNVKGLAGLDQVVPLIDAIIDVLIPIAKRRTTKFVIAKLVVAASTYVIWKERNWRLFKGQKRSINEVADTIQLIVRLKLLSCSFKKSKDGLEFVLLWKLPESIISST